MPHGHDISKRRPTRKRRAGRSLEPGTDAELNLTPAMLQQAATALRRRVKIDRNYDIPYLAGYSRAGRTIYIDRHLPKTFKYRGKRVRIEPFMLLHECVEIALLDKLDLAYRDAHLVALMAERSAVEAAGVRWKAYHQFMLAHIKEAGSKKLTRVPRRLHLTPYLDEQDLELLQQMLPLMYSEWE